MHLTWQASAKIETLQARAGLMATIRGFFASRSVLEVDTPLLSRGTITDPHLDAMHTLHTNPMSVEKTQLFLQTSPEFAMKRLLCGGMPSIYQICKAFRDDEVGRYHNPEFTMLEWYRLDFTMQDLIDEVGELLQCVLACCAPQQLSYQQVFLNILDIDPLAISLADLIRRCDELGYSEITRSMHDGLADVSAAVALDNTASTNPCSTTFDDSRYSHHKDTLLQLLFCEHVERQIGHDVPVVITHFPASQAALSKINPDDPRSALRFEVYYKGIELANGFEELQDVKIQEQRMLQDNKVRKTLGKSSKPLDTLFLDALEHGLPQCAGVALGLDRLFMLALNQAHINGVLAFPFENA